MASLITLLILIAILGLVLWAIQRYLPIENTPKQLLMFIAVLCFCLYLLRWAGIF